MQGHGMRPDQVTQVRGFADQRLRMPNDPTNPANRRVSLIVQYLVKKDGKDSGNGTKPAGAANTAAAPLTAQPAKAAAPAVSKASR